jgi:hypothetical protein
MTVSHAKTTAGRWAVERARRTVAIRAAVFIGAISHLTDFDELPAGSDVDLMFLVDDDAVESVGHMRVRVDGVLVDASSAGLTSLGAAEAVLSDYLLGAIFSVPCVIFDRSGLLEPLNARVMRDFQCLEWIVARYESLLAATLDGGVRALAAARSMDEAVYAFGSTILYVAHLPLVASLRVPTVRKALRECLCVFEGHARCDLADAFSAFVLDRSVSSDDLRAFVARCARSYDYACSIRRSPTRFDFDVSPLARDHAIGGALDLIDGRWPQSAAWWIFYVWHALMETINADAPPAALDEHRSAHLEFLAATGLGGEGSVEAKAHEAEALVRAVDGFCRPFFQE